MDMEDNCKWNTGSKLFVTEKTNFGECRLYGIIFLFYPQELRNKEIFSSFCNLAKHFKICNIKEITQ